MNKKYGGFINKGSSETESENEDYHSRSSELEEEHNSNENSNETDDYRRDQENSGEEEEQASQDTRRSHSSGKHRSQQDVDSERDVNYSTHTTNSRQNHNRQSSYASSSNKHNSSNNSNNNHSNNRSRTTTTTTLPTPAAAQAITSSSNRTREKPIEKPRAYKEDIEDVQDVDPRGDRSPYRPIGTSSEMSPLPQSQPPAAQQPQQPPERVQQRHPQQQQQVSNGNSPSGTTQLVSATFESRQQQQQQSPQHQQQQYLPSAVVRSSRTNSIHASSSSLASGSNSIGFDGDNSQASVVSLKSAHVISPEYYKQKHLINKGLIPKNLAQVPRERIDRSNQNSLPNAATTTTTTTTAATTTTNGLLPGQSGITGPAAARSNVHNSLQKLYKSGTTAVESKTVNTNKNNNKNIASDNSGNTHTNTNAIHNNNPASDTGQSYPNTNLVPNRVPPSAFNTTNHNSNTNTATATNNNNNNRINTTPIAPANKAILHLRNFSSDQSITDIEQYELQRLERSMQQRDQPVQVVSRNLPRLNAPIFESDYSNNNSSRIYPPQDITYSEQPREDDYHEAQDDAQQDNNRDSQHNNSNHSDNDHDDTHQSNAATRVSAPATTTTAANHGPPPAQTITPTTMTTAVVMPDARKSQNTDEDNDEEEHEYANQQQRQHQHHQHQHSQPVGCSSSSAVQMIYEHPSSYLAQYKYFMTAYTDQRSGANRWSPCSWLYYCKERIHVDSTPQYTMPIVLSPSCYPTIQVNLSWFSILAADSSLMRPGFQYPGGHLKLTCICFPDFADAKKYKCQIVNFDSSQHSIQHLRRSDQMHSVLLNKEIYFAMHLFANKKDQLNLQRTAMYYVMFSVGRIDKTLASGPVLSAENASNLDSLMDLFSTSDTPKQLGLSTQITQTTELPVATSGMFRLYWQAEVLATLDHP